MALSGQDVVLALKKTRNDLFTSVEKWRTYGIALASAERGYRVALSKMIIRLHEERKVAWTAAGELARGMDACESLRFAKDVALVHYNAEQELINILKMEARFLEGEIKQDMGGYVR